MAVSFVFCRPIARDGGVISTKIALANEGEKKKQTQKSRTTLKRSEKKNGGRQKSGGGGGVIPDARHAAAAACHGYDQFNLNKKP